MNAPALEFGRINVPTDNPGKCSRCNRTHAFNKRPLDIHWSIRFEAWLCMWCLFDRQDATQENKT